MNELVDYMVGHSNFATNQIFKNGHSGKDKVLKLWNKLVRSLNGLDKQHSLEQWQKVNIINLNTNFLFLN